MNTVDVKDDIREKIHLNVKMYLTIPTILPSWSNPLLLSVAVGKTNQQTDGNNSKVSISQKMVHDVNLVLILKNV